MTLEFHEIDLKLQRRIGQQSHEVGLCSYLQRHQVENHDFKWTDFLAVSPALVHHKDILMLQQLDGWQFIW